MLKTNGPPFRMGQAMRSLPSPSLLRRSSYGGWKRLRSYALKRFNAQARRQVAILSCSRTGSTLRASNTKCVTLRDELSHEALREAASNTASLLNDFFDHSRLLLALKSSRAHTGFLREIFNRP